MLSTRAKGRTTAPAGSRSLSAHVTWRIGRFRQSRILAAPGSNPPAVIRALNNRRLSWPGGSREPSVTLGVVAAARSVRLRLSGEL
jgi:hypothetical protein